MKGRIRSPKWRSDVWASHASTCAGSCGVVSRMTGKDLAPPEPCTLLYLEPGLWEIQQDLSWNRTSKVRMPQVLPPCLPNTAQSREWPEWHPQEPYPHKATQRSQIRLTYFLRALCLLKSQTWGWTQSQRPSSHLHAQWLLGNSGHQRLEQTHNSWEIVFTSNAMLT